MSIFINTCTRKVLGLHISGFPPHSRQPNKCINCFFKSFYLTDNKGLVIIMFLSALITLIIYFQLSSVTSRQFEPQSRSSSPSAGVRAPACRSSIPSCRSSSPSQRSPTLPDPVLNTVIVLY